MRRQAFEEVEKVRMENPFNIQPATDLLDGLTRSIHTTYWSYCAELERLRVFKKGHDEDTRSWSDCAADHPADLNLQQLAENGSHGTDFLGLLVTELEGFSRNFQNFARFVDDVELQLGILKTRANI
jgi:hypothetical protein